MHACGLCCMEHRKAGVRNKASKSNAIPHLFYTSLKWFRHHSAPTATLTYFEHFFFVGYRGGGPPPADHTRHNQVNLTVTGVRGRASPMSDA
jgi:hypothetical protein